jgi:PBP1b-binding outer membrane lipoprotein LpoB
MKLIRLTVVALTALFLSGCYAHFKAPAPELSVPLTAEKPEKAGQASCQQILWSFAFGDCSVKTAMQSGGINTIHHVDSEVRVILWGAFSEYTVRAWGE